MHGKRQFHNLLLNIISRVATVALAIAVVFGLTVVLTQWAQAQTFTVIHNFTGGGDGAYPATGLTMNATGNLYGTTWYTDSGGHGTIFELKHSGSGWVLSPLYSFAGGNDGAYPYGRVAIAQDGTLYGTTTQGGEGDCGGYTCGTVFRLTPPQTVSRTALAPWTETVLYRFTGGEDGGGPSGDLTFDQLGNIYGTGRYPGVIYELTPSGGGWTETVLYSDFEGPEGGVVFDKPGNLYGVLEPTGQYRNGAVYQLSPSASGWTGHTLYSFTGGGDGRDPLGGLIIDSSGNLYGTTALGGSGDAGTVFELTQATGSWTFKTLYSFPGPQNWGPEEKLVMDAAGNLYGTARNGGANRIGSVFRLTPVIGGWTYTSLHDFTLGGDGGEPVSSLVFDAYGNLYGTALAGGAYGYGVVFEITP